MKRAPFLISFLFSLVITRVAYAEVMDKEPSLFSIWVWAFLGSAIGLFLATRRRWLAAVSFPIVMFRPFQAIFEFWDPFVGPAIIKEAGIGYGIQAYCAAAVVIVAHAAGIYFGTKRRRRASQQHSQG